MSTLIESAEKVESLAQRYARVRQFSEVLCETLEPEDCCIQSMPDVSPTRWHLAHTTWFFEAFVLARSGGYSPLKNEYLYLFNSYYNALGKQFPRAQRGLLSRPTVKEVMAYRHAIDEQMQELMLGKQLHSGGDLRMSAEVIELGLHHEQQHQELMLTDIKHVFSCNPLYPVYRATALDAGQGGPAHGGSEIWSAVDDGVYEIGHEGSGFAYDNEMPRHRVFLESFELANHLVTCQEYLDFIADGGYERPELWLSEGWQTVRDEGWCAPLYWVERDGRWQHFTLAGLQPLDGDRPVCHVSYFEADAFARWRGARLPTEAEWEVTGWDASREGNFADTLTRDGQAIHPRRAHWNSAGMQQVFGDVWEWTSSAYAPYPGYRAAASALGEYNGKFMCNQYVLRGGSCATSSDHIRLTYRNFFPASARWQFTGIRLAR